MKHSGNVLLTMNVLLIIVNVYCLVKCTLINQNRASHDSAKYCSISVLSAWTVLLIIGQMLIILLSSGSYLSHQ